MKIERLIGIMTVLLQQQQITAPELAQRFEVSRRTINRDIEDLCRAGIPLVTTQGHGGGISIVDGYKVEQSLLNYEEWQAIFTALKGIDSVSKTSYLSALLEKLSRRDAKIVSDDVILIDLAFHYQASLTQKIDAIQQAVHLGRCITFRYYYEKGEEQRLIEPYRLVFRWSSWYVFGFCLTRNAFRWFRLNRLWELAITEQEYIPREIPQEELDFSRYFSSDSVRLKALFYPSEKHFLIEEYGIDCYTVTPEGMLYFEWDFVSEAEMRRWVLSFGDRVLILEPEQLRQQRLQQAANILKQEQGT